MKLTSIIVISLLITACSTIEVANSSDKEGVQFVDKHCGNHQSQRGSHFFSSFLDSQYQKITELKGFISDQNYKQLHIALSQFNEHWEMLNQQSYEACEKLARCEFIKEQYIASFNKQQRNRMKLDADKQNMCDKSSFEFDLSRVKMVSFYSDVERLELVREDQ
ncbi:hypothetical protein [Photobacterium angustum]|uniref:hypothetical protein n=1 Tax=Photobacterium angustum TaxID=661 RepID=UPI0005DC6C13|nr:hypothetical protein [Photobacterium angustum]KJG02959.1 hypothetical protein UB35_04460 [Photobacterium angustum]KJG17756.1 hypothetical protein UA33_07225 [Photobacterium angustum]KJG24963.1 hypothetical protein UA39_06780 [Photobacterium angustum]KJG32908.1 hypothetical protein UA36_05560 [Photobacterium angustum]PSV65540.1 hypothetical protein CTM95_15450 [Photobacterium angustum]